MKFTKPQRKRIYLETAQGVFDKEGDIYLCGQIVQSAKRLGYDYNSCLIDFEDFPELELFKPTVPEEGSLWWRIDGKKGYLKSGIEKRVITTLLCAEMCS